MVGASGAYRSVESMWMIEYWPVERWRWQLVLQHHLMNSMMACGAGRTVVVTGGI